MPKCPASSITITVDDGTLSTQRVFKVTFNPVIRRRLNKLCLTQVGDISWPEHIAIFTTPIRIATQMGIRLVVWGENTVFCTFPKGAKAGLTHEDMGVLTVYDSNNNPYQAYQTHYQWKNGLVVKDWRYVVRICNINTANLVANTSAADLIALMSRALDRIPNWGMGTAAFYMNRTVYSMLRVQAMNKSQNVLAIEKGLNQFGTAMTWLSFQGVPLRRVDQLVNTEARVV